MTGFISVYVTTPSLDEARKIAQVAVGENLAACANIMPDGESVYRWQGKIEKAKECALILKMAADKFPALEARIKTLHSYECPCIVAWPIVAGSSDYLAWLAGN